MCVNLIYSNLVIACRVPTSPGNHGKPGKSQKSSMHGKIMEFEKPELSWKNHGIL